MRLESKENVMSTGMGPAKKFSEMVKLRAANIWPATSPWKRPLLGFHWASASSWKLTVMVIDLKKSISWIAPGLETSADVLSDMFCATFFFLAHWSSTLLRGNEPHLASWGKSVSPR